MTACSNTDNAPCQADLLSTLHDAAKQGDAGALQRLIAAVDPAAAEKVNAVLRSQRGRQPLSISKDAVVYRAPGKVLYEPYINSFFQSSASNR